MLYVWFDAPIGYISNTKELLPDSWEKYWKDPETRVINFIGKDNIVFHCIVFPAMLPRATPPHINHCLLWQIKRSAEIANVLPIIPS